MARNRRQRWSRRPRLVLAVLVLASISLITLDVRGGGHGDINRIKTWASDAFDPVRHEVDDLTRPVAGFFAGAFEASSVQRTNSQLREQIGGLEEQLDQQGDLERRIQVLESLYDLPFRDRNPRGGSGCRRPGDVGLRREHRHRQRDVVGGRCRECRS